MKHLLLIALLFTGLFTTAQVTYPLRTLSNGSSSGGIDSIRFLNTNVLFNTPSAFVKSGTTGVVTESLASQTAGTIFGNATASSATPTFTPTPVIATSLGVGSTTQPVASSLLELTSTTKGVLIPRMTLTQRDAITSPATGLTIYNTTTSTQDYYNGTIWKNTSAYVRKDNIGITHSDNNGLIVENATPATVGLSQLPPDIVATGLGWGTTLASSQRIGYRLKVDATNGSVPVSTITLDSWFNGAYQTEMTITGGSSRNVSFPNTGTFAGTISAPNISLPFNNTGIVFTAGQGSIFNNAGIFTYNSSSGHLLSSAANAATSGSNTLVALTQTFNPTSGTATFNGLSVNTTINQTGSASGNTYGVRVQAVLTAAANFRAFESATGSIVFPFQAISSTGNISNNVYATYTTGTNTQTLPNAVGNGGKILIIKNKGTGTLTINTAGGLIDGVSSKMVTSQYGGFMLQSDNVDWNIIAVF
jgi:hypothetical protein